MMTLGRAGRRGLFAGAAAVLSAGLARLAGAGRAEASHTGGGTPASDTIALHVGQTNNSINANTLLQAAVGGSSTLTGYNVSASTLNATDGLRGRTTGSGVSAGVRGILELPSTGAGVYGEGGSNGDGIRGDSAARSGVLGVGASAAFGFASPTGRRGVLGLSDTGTGVHGISTDGIGVIGEASNGASSQPGVKGTGTGGVGVLGTSTSNAGVMGTTTGSGFGVAGRGPGIAIYGYSDAPASAQVSNACGVRGEAVHVPGVYGKSTNHAGVYSEGGGGNIALFGITQTGTALAAQATSPGGQAGLFLGNVNIIGNLTVTGSFPKSAGVPHPDGSIRRMYCLEGTESAFEDWGAGQLQGGRADITLDPEFAALVTADDYAVFLTPEGDCRGLFVHQKTAKGFEVRELAGGTSSVPFSYRVLARRKDLVGKTRRMERVDAPKGTRRGGDRGVQVHDADLPSRVTPLTPPNPVSPPAPHDGSQNERPRRIRDGGD